MDIKLNHSHYAKLMLSKTYYAQSYAGIIGLHGPTQKTPYLNSSAWIAVLDLKILCDVTICS